MILSGKYRIYPTKAQISKLKEISKAHTILYNLALEQKNKQYSETKHSDSCFDQIKSIIPEFKLKSEARYCNYSALQQTIRRLHKNFTLIYKRKGGRPRFKSEISIEYGKHGDGWTIKENGIRVQHIGIIYTDFYRKINGIPNNLVIKHEKEKYFACISYETKPNKIDSVSNEIVGIDFGLKTFLTFSNGEKIDHLLPLKKSRKKLARAKRQIRSSKKGNNKIRLNKKYKIKYKIENKIKNQRKDFLHKLSRKLVNRFSYIAVEDLNLKSLTRNKISNINKKYSDEAVGMFYNFLSYKAESAGRQFVKVEPQNTSRECNKCGKINIFGLKERMYSCECGNVEDRDIHAAKNILSKALKTVGLYSLEQS